MMRVSIVLPTRNAGAALDRLLTALAGQAGVERELIAIDSGSTDGTPDRLRAAGASVVTIPAERFNHGATRNQALAQASGDIAVLIVQDALPTSPQWLASLVRPLAADPTIAGTFGRQCPWPDASRLTRHYLSQWIAAQETPRVVGPLTHDALATMSPAERHLACAFDNVCSSVRMSVWRQHPFRSTPIAEDLEWALEVLRSGYKLAYVPDAVVWHSHERSVSYELQRTYLVHQRLQTLFGLSTVPTLPSLARAVASTVPLHVRMAAAEPRARGRACMRGAALAVALPLGQYLGARSARDGRELLRTRDI